MADPTVDFLDSLDDPRLYHKVEAVPVFVPHKLWKRAQTGELVEVEVTEGDLREIAEHNNRREAETGTLAVITLGHRRQDPGVKETDQPPVVGFGRDWRPGTFGPGKVPCLLYDELVRQEDRAEAGKYPFRSADFYRGRMEISGVAKLKRDPELDLGIVVYAGSEALLCYAREVQYMADMPDPTMPPDPDAAATPPAPEMAPAVDDEHEQYMRHCAAHPYARGHHEKMLQYAMEAAGSGAGGPPAAPAAPPAPVPPADAPPEGYARADAALSYARLDRENKDLKARLAQLEGRAAASEREARLTQYRRELEQLRAEGVMLDVEDEMSPQGSDCGAMDRPRFDRHKGRAVLLYSRDPARLTTVQVARDLPRPAKFGPRELALAEEYMRRHEGCDALDAEEYARGQRTLSGTPVNGQART